jgi:hypothetical protein
MIFRVGKAVSINKNVRTPASFYYLLGGEERTTFAVSRTEIG